MAEWPVFGYFKKMETASISEYIWQLKYRYCDGPSIEEQDIGDTWRRVAAAAATIERRPEEWRRAFYGILSAYRFLPGGRILAGAGTARRVTLHNCFVMGPIHDSVEGILRSLKAAAVTLQRGGGIGCDFSTLRPAGLPTRSGAMFASGPVAVIRLWDALCETLMGTSLRRGAMMATLRCDHPDIEVFIDAKRSKRVLNNFNLSVLITDGFMNAVADDALWDLRFPAPIAVNESNMSAREPEADKCCGVHVHRQVSARALWRRIVESAYQTGEPGVLFVDTINRDNNLFYCETISATNPCGEIPLPPHGACDLGSLNLAAFVHQPFSKGAELDMQALGETARIAVRFLDNVIDISRYPLEEQATQAYGTRRIGLGITGLADMLVMLGLHYDSDSARTAATDAMKTIRNAAYASSIGLALKKGPFPLFEKKKYLHSPFVRRLPDELQAGISKNGIRNSHLLAIAPAGTISLLADNVSSGIEPIYAYETERDIRGPNLKTHRFLIRDHAYRLWQNAGHKKAELPEYFVVADALPPQAQLEMHANLQQFVDNAVSKTTNLPKKTNMDDVANIYTTAYRLGIKGCTIFRSGLERGQVLRPRDELHCCHFEREAD